MAELMPGNVLITVQVERSLQALDPDERPECAGLVALARLYALTLHESGPTQNALKEIGPKLTATLVAIGKLAAVRPGTELPAPAPAAPVVGEVEAARTVASVPAGVLDLERARVDRARRAQ